MRDDGSGYNHASCETPEMQSLRAALGHISKSRERLHTDEMAKQVGHLIRLERSSRGFHWVCACGLQGSDPGFDKAEQRKYGRDHLRCVITGIDPT
jgi:hypothetical protein